MYKNATFQEKFLSLKEWMPHLVESVKKDLKNEHLKKDFQFNKKYFASKNINKLSVAELTEAYETAIQQEPNGEELAAFISSRWLLKNSELYHFFEQQLSQINPDFTQLDEISSNDAERLISSSVAEHGPVDTYLFSVLNSVVFPEQSFHHLKDLAAAAKVESVEQSTELAQKFSMETIQAGFEAELLRLKDKYEKKLSGLQKKYTVDVESLKKQIGQLQRKLQEKGCV